MKNLMKRIALYLLCTLWVICFACCGQPDSTGSTGSQDTVADSIQDDNSSQDTAADSIQDDNSSQNNSGAQDENELPRVPYGNNE